MIENERVIEQKKVDLFHEIFRYFLKENIYMLRIWISSMWEEAFESEHWQQSIPFISFPSDWLIQIIPPSLSCIIRLVITKKGLSNCVEAHLDGYGVCSSYTYKDGPFWEVKALEAEPTQIAQGNTMALIACISAELEKIALAEEKI